MESNATHEIPHAGKWIATADNIDQAVERYHGKQFKVRFSADHHVIVKVEKVELYGGAVRTFCTVVKTVKRWQGKGFRDKSRYDKKGEYLFSGRLEPI